MVARWLGAHPDISMAEPLTPEPKFFLEPNLETDMIDSYLRTAFSNRPQTRLLGEKSTSYIESPQAMSRIAQTFPDAPVICLVRDPIARAISNVGLSQRHGFEGKELDAALWRELRGDAEPAQTVPVSVSPFNYLGRGRYDQLLPDAKAVFGSRLLVWQTERLSEPAAAEILCAHLGVKRCANMTNDPIGPAATPLDPRLVEAMKAYFAPVADFFETNFSDEINLSLWPTLHQTDRP